MEAKERIGGVEGHDPEALDRASGASTATAKPLLMVDIDGVISLFGAAARTAGGTPDGPAIEGSFHSIEGIPHFLSATAATHLLNLSSRFALVWASGWEERAD